MKTLQAAYIGPGYALEGRGIVEEIIFDQGRAEIIYRHDREVVPSDKRLAVIAVTAEALKRDFLEDLWGGSKDVLVSVETLEMFWITLPGEEF